jgi:hypothetical protein
VSERPENPDINPVGVFVFAAKKLARFVNGVLTGSGFWWK